MPPAVDHIGANLCDADGPGQRNDDHERVMKNAAKQPATKHFEYGNSGAGPTLARESAHA
jgi:hypothetical protein